MAKPNAPVELFFLKSVRARGEHISGTQAFNEDGTPNMVIIKAGETRKMIGGTHSFNPYDLVIAKQAISVRDAKAGELEDAKQAVRDRERWIAKSNTDATQSEAAKKKTA